MSKLIYDIGGTNTKFAVMTEDGQILLRKKIPTPRESLEAYLNGLVSLAEDCLEGADGVGISTNGRMDAEGDTYRAYTMDFLTGINIKKEMEARLHLPVVVENDGEAAAIGEWWKGAGQGTRTMMCFVMGSGMGGGMIIDGKPFRGSKRNGTMVFGQHSVIDPENGRFIISGLESSFSFTLFKASAAMQIPMQEMTGERFFEMVEEGNPVALHLLKGLCMNTAVPIFNSALLIDPERIVVTGGLCEQPKLIQGIQDALKEIAEKSMFYQGMDLRVFEGIGFAPEDFSITITKGELALDANLYGALYLATH